MPAAPFYPTFELTVYAPRSIDATEATILTPVGGAPHADQFIVTSRQGIAGSKPYLDIPNGRSGAIDPLNKTTTVGTVNLRLLDARTTPGGANASRWVTAFLGDGSGGNRLLGRKIRVRQSWDLGVSWDAMPAYSGRISGTKLDGKNWVGLTVRDPSKDLDVEIFANAPAAAVAGYAQLAQIAPLGLLQDYGGFPKTTPLRGTTQAPAPGTKPPFKIVVDRSNGDLTRTLITQALMDVQRKTILRTDKATDAKSQPRPKLYLRSTIGAGAYTEYDVDWFAPDSTSLTAIFARPTQDAGAAAPPAGGTVVEFYVADPLAEPTERLPLLINDVNPIQYLRDLAAGYFGKLDAAGNPIRAVPIDAASFTAVDTGRFVPYRKRVTKKAKLNAEFEEVCRSYHLNFYLNGGGQIVLVDPRRTATTAPAANLTDADLYTPTDALNWQQDGDSAVTALLGTFYTERQISIGELPKPFESLPAGDFYGDAPDVPSIRIADAEPLSVLVPVLGPRSGDVRPSTFKVDATGLRVRVGGTQSSAETLSGASRADAIQSHFVAYAAEVTGPFGLGPSYIDIVCRRASANVAAITQGKFAGLTFTALPDPATNFRGGARLAFCISRLEDGSRVKLRLLDAGANAVALVPAIGALAATGGTTNVGVSVPITLNAAGEPARISFAVTDTTVAVRPVEDDPKWTAGPLATAAATYVITNVPHTARVWVRARSEPSAGAGFKLPSAWAFPGGTGYAVTTVLAAPSGLAVTGATAADTVAAWTIGEVWAEVDVLLVAGVAPGAWLDSMIVSTLPPGSSRRSLASFITAGNQFTVGVRHRDLSGGTSAVVSSTFVAGALGALQAPVAAIGFSEVGKPPTRRLAGFGGLVGVFTGMYGMAVEATEFPSLVEVQEAVETAVAAGTYGAYATAAIKDSVSGDFTVAAFTSVNDGLRRRLRARHTRDSATPSAWTSPVIVSPWTYAPLVLAEAEVSLNNWQPKDSVDGLTRTFTMLAGARVHRVFVFSLKLAVQSNTNPFPSSDATKMAAWKAAGGVMDPIPLVPDPVTRIVAYTVTKPSANYQLFLQFEARLEDLSQGDIKRATVDPAPSALTATIKGAVTNATADLSANVQASLADYGDTGVQVDFYADDPFGAVLATKTIFANATLDKTTPGLAALGGVTLPQRQGRQFWIKLTNCTGEVWLSDPITLDRDSLPYCFVTVKDYVAAPTIVVNYDDDTDTVKIYIPGGKSKTFVGLVGAGQVSYQVGDGGLDAGAAAESALDLEETRSGYRVDATGGGTTLTFWGVAGGTTGILHGQVLGAIPQGTVSVNRNGDWSWTVDGPKDQHHVHYAESNSAFPSDATAAAGTNINGRQVTRSGGATLLRGQAIYVTIISYNAANVALQSIRLRGDFQDNAIPQGSVSIDADGAWGWAIDGPQFQASVTYAESTSAFPSDGTAAAGTVINGRQVSRTGGTALTFGQTKYVTIVPWTGSGGTGEQLPSIRLRGSYQTFTATKFDTFPGSSFVPRDSALTTVRTDPSVGTFIADPGSNPIKAQGSLSPRLSSGLTITSLSLYGMQTFSGGGTHRLVVDLHRITKSTQAFTSIAQAETDASSGAAQLVTVSGLSHTVDTDTYSYQMRLLLADSSSNSTALELWNVTVGYTQNNPSQGL